MAVVLLDHSRVRVTQVCRDHKERSAGHDRKTRVRVPQRMETREEGDPGLNAGFAHWPGLVRLQPLAVILFDEDPLGCSPTGAQLSKLPYALFGQEDVSTLAALARADVHGTGIGVEIADPVSTPERKCIGEPE